MKEIETERFLHHYHRKNFDDVTHWCFGAKKISVKVLLRLYFGLAF